MNGLLDGLLEQVATLGTLHKEIQLHLARVEVTDVMVSYWSERTARIVRAASELLAGIKVFGCPSPGVSATEEELLLRFLLEREAHFRSDEYRAYIRTVHGTDSDSASD